MINAPHCSQNKTYSLSFTIIYIDKIPNQFVKPNTTLLLNSSFS